MFYLKCLADDRPGNMMSNQLKASQSPFAIAEQQQWKTLTCSNAKCQIVKFHYSCLGIASIPKLWYCPTCRTLPEFKRIYKGEKTANLHHRRF